MKTRSVNKWIRLSGAGLQMGITIYVFAWIGKKIDAHYAFEKPWFAISLSLLGVVLSTYVLIKELNRLNEGEEK